MKELVCQLCEVSLDERDLFDHLVNKHNWQIKAVASGDKNLQKNVEQSKKKATKKAKGAWQKSTALLTCPYCKQIFKRKQTLLEHMPKCPQKHITKQNPENSKSDANLPYSYMWACNQRLDPHYEKTLITLANEKSVDYLSGEINNLLHALQTDPANKLIIGRLIIYSKAKQRIVRKEKKDKRGQKIRVVKASSRTDAMDHRLPGSYGSGRKSR